MDGLRSVCYYIHSLGKSTSHILILSWLVTILCSRLVSFEYLLNKYHFVITLRTIKSYCTDMRYNFTNYLVINAMIAIFMDINNELKTVTLTSMSSPCIHSVYHLGSSNISDSYFGILFCN